MRTISQHEIEKVSGGFVSVTVGVPIFDPFYPPPVYYVPICELVTDVHEYYTPVYDRYGFYVYDRVDTYYDTYEVCY